MGVPSLVNVSKASRHWPRLYRCKATRVLDGDTVELRVDTGFYGMAQIDLRLRDVNTAETSGGTIDTRAAGKAAQYYTARWLRRAQQPEDRWPLWLLSRKEGEGPFTKWDPSFTRWVGDVQRPDGVSLVQALLKAGHAVRV